MGSTKIHGWRHYTITRCLRTGELVLRGSYGMHCHTNPAPRAECKGFSPGMWMTPAAQAQGKLLPAEREKHDQLEAPVLNCCCGYYGFRNLKAVETSHPGGGGIIAHVTAIEKTIIHQEGFRTQMYSLDYLLEPPDKRTRIVAFGRGTVGAYGGYMTETVNLWDTLESIAKSLSIPLLARDDLAGCPYCLEANGLRTEAEVAVLKKTWYGES